MQSRTLNRDLIRSLRVHSLRVGSKESCLDTRGRLEDEDVGSAQEGTRDLRVDLHGEEEAEAFFLDVKLVEFFFKLG